MNRNTNAHFAEMPSVDIQRSILDRSCSHKFAGNVGDIIPIYVDPDVLPGDTVSMDTSKVIRFQTMLTPMMDNIQCDIYWFFVPHRLVWDHWANFMGENTASAWIPSVEYSVPQLRVPPKGSGSNNKVGTILDYMGFPVEMPLNDSVDVNALPIRAYCKVMDDWFRSEALTDPINQYTGDATVTATTEVSYINDVPHGGLPYKAAKYSDYFTSCLPAPQKGSPVTFPINVGGDEVGVFTSKNDYSSLSGDYKLWFVNGDSADGYGAALNHSGTEPIFTSQYSLNPAATVDSSSTWPINLAVNIPLMHTSFSVNDMRYAFQLQKLLEKDARSGSRYIEVIREHFGIQSSDARLQRSEYLGGNRFGIVVDQVANQAQTENDFLGDLGALSVTSDVHSDFTFSAQEHGTLLGLMVLRYDHTYSQGLEKFWSRKTRFDYYWPVFANIGEQPVMKKEIFLTGDSEVDDKTFGFNEAWADYRYKPNRVSSYMRPYVSTGLFSWSLADDYNSSPSLSDGWIREDGSTVDRVLAVTKQASGFQFWADVYFSTKYTRPMPVYSVPGLIDHH